MTRYLGASAYRLGVVHSALAAEPSVVAEEAASVNTKCQEVAKVAEVAEVVVVTSHDYGLKRDGPVLRKSAGKKPGHCTLRRRTGWSREKQE